MIDVQGLKVLTDMDAVTSFKFFAADAERAKVRVSQQPLVEREAAYYRDNIGSIKTAEELVNNTRLFKFAMKAHGLEEFDYAKAFMRKVFEGGIDDPDSLANQLTDSRYQEIAETFNFKNFGDATTSFTRAGEGTIDKYIQQTLESQLGEDNTGARLAVYFQRKIGDISNATELLGDVALIQVVQTAFSLPSQMSLLSIEKQEVMINDKMDFEDMKDSGKVDELVNRFLTMWDISNPSSGSVSVSPLISDPFGSQVSLSADLISTLQNVRRF